MTKKSFVLFKEVKAILHPRQGQNSNFTQTVIMNLNPDEAYPKVLRNNNIFYRFDFITPEGTLIYVEEYPIEISTLVEGY